MNVYIFKLYILTILIIIGIFKEFILQASRNKNLEINS